MKQLMKRADSSLFSGRLMRRWQQRYQDRCVQIMCYHSVARTPCVLTEGTTLCHGLDEFERQVDYFAERYRPMSLRRLTECIAEGRSVDRAVVFTFDDGFADNLRRAMPILYRRRIPMTIFPTAGVIGNTDLMWTHKLAWLIHNGQGDRLLKAMRSEGYREREIDEAWPDYARRVYRADLPALLESLIRDACKTGSGLARELRPYLEPDEMAGVDPEFVEFGNHTLTHPVLSELNAAQQEAEIREGARIITAITGITPLAFAYPFGLKRHYTDETQQLVRSAGHQAALDMRRRINTGKLDPFQLSRRPAPHGPRELMDSLIAHAPANAYLPHPNRSDA